MVQESNLRKSRKGSLLVIVANVNLIIITLNKTHSFDVDGFFLIIVRIHLNKRTTAVLLQWYPLEGRKAPFSVVGVLVRVMGRLLCYVIV